MTCVLSGEVSVVGLLQCQLPVSARFSCADCPRRNSKAASEADELSSEPMAVAAFVGEEVAATNGGCARKTQCLLPDKPMMFPGPFWDIFDMQ